MLQMLLAWLRWVILDLSSRFSEDLMCSFDLSRERSMLHFLIALLLLSASPFTSFMHFLLAFCSVSHPHWFSLSLPLFPSSKAFVEIYFIQKLPLNLTDMYIWFLQLYCTLEES
jgi:Ni/Fe-hydrogenase subunit HybB-like protein